MLGARLVVVAGLGLVGATGAACGSSPHSTTSGSSTGTATTGGSGSARPTGPSVVEIRRSSRVTVGGKVVAVPTERASHPISSTIDDGQQIIISATGFLPPRLFSKPGIAVTWTNLTDEPQQVIFDYLPVKSPLIPPGGDVLVDVGVLAVRRLQNRLGTARGRHRQPPFRLIGQTGFWASMRKRWAWATKGPSVSIRWWSSASWGR